MTREESDDQKAHKVLAKVIRGETWDFRDTRRTASDVQWLLARLQLSKDAVQPVTLLFGVAPRLFYHAPLNGQILVPLLRATTRLTELDLSGQDLRSSQSLHAALPTTLVSLDMSHTNLRITGLLVTRFKACPNMSRLSLLKCDARECTAMFLDYISAVECFTSLDLPILIKSEGLMRIARALASNRKMRSLGLYYVLLDWEVWGDLPPLHSLTLNDTRSSGLLSDAFGRPLKELSTLCLHMQSDVDWLLQKAIDHNALRFLHTVRLRIWNQPVLLQAALLQMKDLEVLDLSDGFTGNMQGVLECIPSRVRTLILRRLFDFSAIFLVRALRKKRLALHTLDLSGNDLHIKDVGELMTRLKKAGVRRLLLRDCVLEQDLLEKLMVFRKLQFLGLLGCTLGPAQSTALISALSNKEIEFNGRTNQSPREVSHKTNEDYLANKEKNGKTQVDHCCSLLPHLRPPGLHPCSLQGADEKAFSSQEAPSTPALNNERCSCRDSYMQGN